MTAGDVVRLIVIVAGAGILDLLSCVIWKWAPCGWCRGTGRNWGSDSRRHGDCWWCKGRGRNLRLGARLLRRGRR